MIGAWLARPASPDDADLRLIVPPGVAMALVRRYVASLPAPDPGGETALEVFLRIGPLDFDIAPVAYASLQTHLMNRLSATVIATPRAHVSRARDLFAGAEVIADEDLLPADMRDAIERATLEGRSSWVRQQFLSLVYVSTRAQGPCLVWDADTLMLRPQSLLRGDVATLAVSLEHHQPYFDVIRRLLPSLPLPVYTSTVAHHMVMDPGLLRELQREIERGPAGGPWWRAILDCVNRREPSPMADYELYGQWVRTRHPDRVQLVAFRNVGRSRVRLLGESGRALPGDGLDSVSAHWYISEEPS